jgi:SAM-dependent methyltransferase
MSQSFYYEPDLAYIHHAGHGDFARQVAPNLIRLLRGSGVPGGLVVDLGCGSGILAHELTRAGYDVLGVDLSPEMIKLARKNAPQARFITGSLYEVDLPPCDAVVAIGEVFNYIPPVAEQHPRLSTQFFKIAQALRKGGAFLFDVLVQATVKNVTYEKWSEGEDWAAHVTIHEDRTARTVDRQITLFRQVGELYRRTNETHRLYMHWRSQIERDLRQFDFAYKYSHRYDDYVLLPRRLAFHATKGRPKGPS